MEFKFVINFIVLLSLIEDSALESSGNLFYIGPGCFSESRTRPRKNLVILSQDGAQTSGILAGFAAYIIRPQPVEFQIWRPDPSNKTSFKLVETYPYTVSPDKSIPNYQDIYIQSLQRECIAISEGDRLGIYFKSTEWPVPYRFIGDGGSEKQLSLMLDMDGKGDPLAGSTYGISELIFPYQFSMAAWVVNAPINSKPTCPDVKFPPWTATLKPTTSAAPRSPPMGNTGNTGATGPKGPSGPVGSTGQMGPQNDKVGPLGVVGPIGAMGDTGSTGVKGITGPLGLTGPKGLTGKSGVSGAHGVEGVRGPPGKDGTDALIPAAGGLQSVQQTNWWKSVSLVKGLYAWATILSVLVLVAFVCSVFLLCMVEGEKRKRS